MQNNVNSDFFSSQISLQNYFWKLIPRDKETEHLSLYLTQKYDVPNILVPFLKNNGINKENFELYLNSKIKDFIPDPFYFTDMKKTVERLADEIVNNRPIGIFGDYDVDGAASTAMLYQFFNYCGLKTFVHIPDRFLEGYGPNSKALIDLTKKGSKLVITVDCGITSHEPLEAMKKTKIDVIIMDHHQPGTKLPPAYSIINPKRLDNEKGFEYLCAAGVTFMVLIGLNRELRNRGFYKNLKEPNLINFVDLVALATVCDVVPLQGLNRVMVKHGITVMKSRKNIGIKCLSDVSNLNSPPDVQSLSFSLGPRINAGGRIGNSKLGVNLLTETDQDNANEIALMLDKLNNKRKLLTAQVEAEAIGMIEKQIRDNNGKTPNFILLSSRNWHEGVIGIVAGKLKEKYKRPSCVISIKEDLCKGSGRSIENISLGDLFYRAMKEKILIKGGGHDMAAGLTIEKNKIDDFKNFLELNMSNLSKNFSKPHILNIAAIGKVSSFSYNLAEWIEKLGPWGEGAPMPMFVINNAQVKNINRFGINKEHVSFKIFDHSEEIWCKKFNIMNSPLNKIFSNSSNRYFNFLGYLQIDTWNNRNRPEFHLIDVILKDQS